jgi:hypothetical protein
MQSYAPSFVTIQIELTLLQGIQLTNQRWHTKGILGCEDLYQKIKVPFYCHQWKLIDPNENITYLLKVAWKASIISICTLNNFTFQEFLHYMPLNMLCIIHHLPKPYTQDLLNKALLFVLVNSWHPIHGTQFKNSTVGKLDSAIQQAITPYKLINSMTSYYLLIAY